MCRFVASKIIKIIFCSTFDGYAHGCISASMTQDDSTSTFTYDDTDGDPQADIFSLHELREVVNSHFKTVCSLEKLAEGGYHKVRLRHCSFFLSLPIFFVCLQVYDIVQDDGIPLGVVRVAAPAFPKDKLESEVVDIVHSKLVH